MTEVRAAPGGRVLPVTMPDARRPASAGWVKVSQRVNGVEIHYVRNMVTGAVDDFKFVGGCWMIVNCKFSRSSPLADHQRGRFANFDQEYAVTAGRDYVVAGVGVWETVLQVLIQDDDRLPSWCPAGLFDLAPPIPAGWLCAVFDGISASGTDLWSGGSSSVATRNLSRTNVTATS